MLRHFASSHRVRFWSAVAFLILWSSVAAWFKAFTSMAPYDDEGTIILLLRNFMSGGILYDRVREVYGPLHYAYQCIPRALFGIPLNHETVRMFSVICRILASLMVFLVVYRATRSLSLAMIAHAAGFQALVFMSMETAHPQELCTVLLLGVFLAAGAERPTAIVWFGVLTATIFFTKINLGILLAAGIAIVIVYSLPCISIRVPLT
ncbi:MAG TPA: hypothetical protein VKE70_22705, partial [Candidatus Solibacter sp.]|nr:hypothetical protein [Candidatus Solibacter sp.]